MKILFTFSVLLWSQCLYATELGCASWPINMAFIHLKNKKVVNFNNILLENTKAILLKIEILEDDLYRQIYKIKYYDKSSRLVTEVITVNDASSEECSMSDVDVYVELK